MSDTCPKCHRPRLDAEHAHARASELARVDVCLLEGAPLCAVAAHAFELGAAHARSVREAVDVSFRENKRNHEQAVQDALARAQKAERALVDFVEKKAPEYRSDAPFLRAKIGTLEEALAASEENARADRAHAAEMDAWRQKTNERFRAMHRRAQAAESRRPFSQYVRLGDDELASACGYVTVTYGGPEQCHETGCERKVTRMYRSRLTHGVADFDGCGRCLRARLMRRGAYNSRGGVDERARRNMDLGAAVRSAASSLDIGEIDAVTHYSMHLEKGSMHLTALRHPGAQLAILRMVAHMRLSQAGPAERAKYEADKAAWLAHVEKNASKVTDLTEKNSTKGT